MCPKKVHLGVKFEFSIASTFTYDKANAQRTPDDQTRHGLPRNWITPQEFPELLQLDWGRALSPASQRQFLPCQLESKYGPDLKSTLLITLCPQQK